MALSHAPNSPEPHQLHASLLVTQRRKAEALQALERSISLWKDKDPQDWPEFGFRLESAKLMTELGDHDRAITMFEALRDEADEVMDAWYYLGWTWYLKGKGGPQETEEDMEMPEPVLDEEGLKRRAECWEEARLAFKMVLKVCFSVGDGRYVPS